MGNYVIITDSCCDLMTDTADELNLVVIPMALTVDGITYKNHLDWREVEPTAFYDMLRNGKTGFTSAVNPDTFVSVFEPILEQGKDILYLAFSSALSSTYSASVIAIEELKSKYPERTMLTVDTLCASLGEGLLVYLTAMEKNKGASITEARDFAEKTKLNICHWFTVDDLAHLKRGGRISAATALVGAVLNIKPILRVDDGGFLVSAGKVRGRRESVNNLAERVQSAITDTEQVFISHADCAEDAEALAAILRKNLNIKNIVINMIGPVIGLHSGPGTLAVFSVGRAR